MDKIYITAQELLEDSFRLAHKVYTDGFFPQFIVGIWRGGTPVGIAVQEYFEYKKVQTDHISVRTSSSPSCRQKCPKSSPTARVAEVKTHAFACRCICA